VSVIGRTTRPAARRAREAGLSYATIALATDYDCWHVDEEDVSVEAVIAILKQNVGNAQEVIKHVAAFMATADAPKRSPFHDVAATAIMTDRASIPHEQRRALSALYAEYLG
jgi:5'-methylthioadenosine phosphorylase